MPFVTAKDDTKLYVGDWGAGRPVVLIHGWPLTGESWEYQSVRLAEAGFRVIAYDRRGFGKSEQPWGGYDYDTFADDLSCVMDELALGDAALVGFSMGGGEVARYMSRHNGKGVTRAALISSVVPLVLKGVDWPDGVPSEALEGIQAGIRKDRQAFMQGFLKSFYGEGLLGIGGVSQAVLDWSWSMAMQASPKATLACVDAFGRTDFRPDMASFKVPTLIVHGTADKTVPIEPTARQAARLIGGAKLIEYEGAAHGLTATHADRLCEDLIAFLKA